MGKNLLHTNLVQRTGKLAFYQVKGIPNRMEGFTDLGYSKNPKEYNRQYVDEDFERSNVVGYSPSVSYAFDRYTGNAVLDDIVRITEDELIGSKAVATIITVDMSTSQTTGGQGTAKAKSREYAVIPDSFGDSTDCLTFSGNFKSCGASKDCVVSTTNDWQTLKSVLYDVEKSATATVSVTGDGMQSAIEVSGQYTSASGNATKETVVTINVTPDFNDAYILIMKDKDIVANGSGRLNYTINSLSEGPNTYSIVVTCANDKHKYDITITGV